jgi:hypothetical protein
MRTTRKQLEGTLSRLCSVSGHVRQVEPGKVGLFLEQLPGGYIIRQKNADGTEEEVFGSRIRTAAELWDVMYFAIQTYPAHSAVARSVASAIR